MANSMDDAAQAVTPRFNLIDEPWIPVRWLDGRHGELGIRDTLLQAERIAEIQDASPLVVAALHRFLLAVLYRALEGPTDGQQAKTWFKQGWPGGKIETYLAQWRERFWLFDPRYPFAQIPSFEPRIWRAWTVLAAEHNADNAKVLFDHVDVNRAGGIAPAQAIRRSGVGSKPIRRSAGYSSTLLNGISSMISSGFSACICPASLTSQLGRIPPLPQQRLHFVGQVEHPLQEV